MTKQFVVEHGTRGEVAGITTTEWQDSGQIFAPKLLRGYNPRYATGARAYCTICKSQFEYKGPRPSSRARAMWFAALFGVGLLILITSRFTVEASLCLLVIFGLIVLGILAFTIKPRPPYLRQLSGPKRFKHRVRPIGPTEAIAPQVVAPPEPPHARAQQKPAKTSCRPSNGEIVRGGMYDSLVIPTSVKNVILDRVVVLDGVTIGGQNVRGILIVPADIASLNLGGNRIHVRRLSRRQIKIYLAQQSA